LQQRHEVIEYRLDGRVTMADHYLTYAWKQAESQRKTRNDPAEPAIPKPQMSEAVRMGSMTLLEAALSMLPDWVLVFSGMFLHIDALICLHRTGCPIAIILTESPYDDAKQRLMIAHCDVAFTNERASLPLLQREQFFNDSPREARVAGNPNTHYLAHAFDVQRHDPNARIDNEEQVPSHDVVFVGSGFSERQELLAQVDWDYLGYDLGLYGNWPYMGSRNRLRQHWRGGVTDNRYAAALYRKAKVGLNIYRRSVGQARNATRIRGAESLNPRALELAALGVPHISDYRAEVEEVFGDLVPMYDPETPGDMTRVMVDLLDDEAHQERMRAELPKRVAGWTFEARVNQVESTLNATRTIPR
jgi:glycosyltransferase involved in cell wall biosynthesis